MRNPFHSNGYWSHEMNRQHSGLIPPIRPYQDPRLLEETGGWMNTGLDPREYSRELDLPSYGSEPMPSARGAHSQNELDHHAPRTRLGQPQQHQHPHPSDYINDVLESEERLANHHVHHQTHITEHVNAGRSGRNSMRSTRRSRDRRDGRRDEQVGSYGCSRDYGRRRNREERFHD